MMKKRILLMGALLMLAMVNAQIPVTKIHTSFNTFWTSGTSTAPNPIRPNNSHNVLGFTWNGTTFSTGVNDGLLTTNDVTFQPHDFTAFPTYTTAIVPGSSTFIGVGSNYGGAGNVVPVPVENNLVKYLTDGSKGLDLGTGIFNFPQSGEILYDITSINPLSIGDNIPDILITQIGDISNVLDRYYFVDASNNVVGSSYNINFGTVADLGNADWKFYNVNTTSPSYNAGVSGTSGRKIRLLALDWAELGLSTTNISQVTKMVQVFSGQSDIAFTAYNTASIILKMPISGRVFNDNNAGTPDGNGYANATVRLKNSLGNIVATTITDANGYYTFPNNSGGLYTIELVVPANYVMVGNSDGNLNNTLPVTLANQPIVDKNFAINRPPLAVDDALITYLNTSGSINILANDSDYNGGVLVPNTVNFILPPTATNVIVTNGYNKGFRIPGKGTWFVDANGLFTFTPETGYSGFPTVVKYTVKDNAGLTSNEANITIEVKSYCFKPATTTGTPLNTLHGITDLGRTGSNINESSNWPQVRKGAWTVLESKTKGFVINRIATTAQVNGIPNPIIGMMVFDQQADCLKININGTTSGWRCFNTAACPD